MALEYRLYKNDSAGGPMDYATPWATTAATTLPTAPLAAGSDNLFGVRVRDTASGLEEHNTAARVRILVDGAGADVTLVPNAPAGLTATPRAGGGALVAWSYPRIGQAAPPVGFRVYVGTPAVSFGAPAATVAYTDGRPAYSATLAGLAEGVAYQVVVRAYNAAGEERNAVVVTVVGSADPPDAVDDLDGTVS